MAPISPSARRTPEPLNSYLKSLQMRRAMHERARLLYVAATRARSELHLFGDLRESASGRAVPSAGSLLATLWPAIANSFPESAEGDCESSKPRSLHVPPLRRLPVNWVIPTIPPDPQPQGISIASYEPRPTTDFLCVADLEHCIGAVVCEELRCLNRYGGLPTPSHWQVRRPALRHRFLRLGLTGEEVDAAVENAIAALTACGTDKRFQWIFSPSHTHTASPLELTGLHEGRLASVSVDRAFVDSAGKRWLIDFHPASARHGEALVLIDQVMERERAMLERYLHFAAALGPEPPRAGLYFPMLAAFRRL